MEKEKQQLQRKKVVANEIVTIFKKIKFSLLMGFVWFIGFSAYNKLFDYLLFDYSFGHTEAEKILGYQPSQYNFVVDNTSKKSNLSEYDEDFLKLLDENFEKFQKQNATNGEITGTNNNQNLTKNNAFDSEIHTGNFELSVEGRLEVKKEITSQLFKNSIIFTLIMIGITFIALMLFMYIVKGLNWTKKYAD